MRHFALLILIGVVMGNLSPFPVNIFRNGALLSSILSVKRKLLVEDVKKLVDKLKFAVQETIKQNKGNIEVHDATLSHTDREFLNRLDEHNGIAFDMLLNLLNVKNGWEVVSSGSGIQVERRYLQAGPFVDPVDAAKGMKHACVKSTAILNTSASAIFDLFLNTARTKEYNSHCVHVEDVHSLPQESERDQWSKISYAQGPRMGPFKARDFCSVVHYRRYTNGTCIILNRPAYYSKLAPTNKYIRATVLLAGNIIEPLGEDRARLTLIAHVNPGGGADTRAAAYLINQLCAVGPPAFLKKIETCSKKM